VKLLAKRKRENIPVKSGSRLPEGVGPGSGIVRKYPYASINNEKKTDSDPRKRIIPSLFLSIV
jgi:hypothetical protein